MCVVRLKVLVCVCCGVCVVRLKVLVCVCFETEVVVVCVLWSVCCKTAGVGVCVCVVRLKVRAVVVLNAWYLLPLSCYSVSLSIFRTEGFSFCYIIKTKHQLSFSVPIFYP